MGSLEFMNQDGDWEKFPSDEDIAILKQMQHANNLLPAMEPEITTRCHLCNEPFPIEDVVLTGGTFAGGFTWCCPKCKAVTSLGKA